MNFLTRRQFMQLSTAAALQLMVGCTSKDIPMDGTPLHHLTKGFRNYPPVPEPATPGISFIFRRIRESYDKPKIPKNHVMEEALALSTFNHHAAASAITWIGHSTYLLWKKLNLQHWLRYISPAGGWATATKPCGAPGPFNSIVRRIQYAHNT